MTDEINASRIYPLIYFTPIKIIQNWKKKNKERKKQHSLLACFEIMNCEVREVIMIVSIHQERIGKK